MKKTIDLGEHRLNLEELLATRMLLCANSGGGKTWAIRRLIEMAGKLVRFWVIDKEGEFFTLGEALDVVQVRAGGAIRPSVRNAGALAMHLLETGVSAVIDISELNRTITNADGKRVPESHEFVRLFLDSLMAAPKRLWEPLIVAIDEAHVYCPEKGHGESVARDSICHLMSAGRKRGFCGVGATQRLSKLSKDFVAEANNVLLGRAVHLDDQRRSCDILGYSKQQATSFRDLVNGTFHGFGPAFIDTQGVFQTHVGPIKTTHGRAALKLAKVPEPSGKIKGKIAALEALENDPERVDDIDQARAVIAQQKSEIEQLKSIDRAMGAEDRVALEESEDIKARAAGDIETARAEGSRQAALAATAIIEQRDQWWNAQLNTVLQHAVERGGIIRTLEKAIEGWSAAEIQIPQPPPIPDIIANDAALAQPVQPRTFFLNERHELPPVKKKPSKPQPAPQASQPVGETRLLPRQVRILAALEWFERHARIVAPTREQVGARVKVKCSGGGFRKDIGFLRSQGLIDYPQDNTLTRTDAGKQVAVDVIRRPIWEDLSKMLFPRQLRMLDVLNQAGKTITRGELASACGVLPAGGGFRKDIGHLRTLSLIEYPDDGTVKLTEWLKRLAPRPGAVA